MKTITTWFNKLNGKTEWDNPDKLRDAISILKDGRYVVEIKEVSHQRSLEQNNAMWAIPYAYYMHALTELGYFKDPSKQQIHEWAMHYCLPEDYKERIKAEWTALEPMVDIKTGELFKTAYRLTSTKMSTKDAMNYYENLQNFYAENLSSGSEDQIPDPDKNYKTKNNHK